MLVNPIKAIKAIKAVGMPFSFCVRTYSSFHGILYLVFRSVYQVERYRVATFGFSQNQFLGLRIERLYYQVKTQSQKNEVLPLEGKHASFCSHVFEADG